MNAEARKRTISSPAWSIAAVVLIAVTVAWLLLTLLDLRGNNGIAPMMAVFGIPAIAAAVIIQIIIGRLASKQRLGWATLWWAVGVLPVGIAGAFVVGVIREPDYFLADGPWTLLTIPLGIVLGLLLGALVWFFFVFPLVTLVLGIRGIFRREVKPRALAMPLGLLALGVLCIVGALSIDTGSSGRAAWGAVIASILGLPGPYDVVWEPGLWIVRGIVLAIVLVFGIPALVERRRTDARPPIVG